MLDVVDKTLAICKTAKEKSLPTVRTLWLALLDPGPETALAGQLAAVGAHPWLFYDLEADVALQEGQVLCAWVY